MNNITTGNDIYMGHMTVRTAPLGLRSARHHIINLIRKLRFNEEESQDVLLAVGEALSNAYKHGTPDRSNGFIYLDWSYVDETFTVAVKDEGHGFPPLGLTPWSDSDLPGNGWGMDLMRIAVDDLTLKYDGGAQVILTKHARSRSRSRA